MNLTEAFARLKAGLAPGQTRRPDIPQTGQLSALLIVAPAPRREGVSVHALVDAGVGADAGISSTVTAHVHPFIDCLSPEARLSLTALLGAPLTLSLMPAMGQPRRGSGCVNGLVQRLAGRVN